MLNNKVEEVQSMCVLRKIEKLCTVKNFSKHHEICAKFEKKLKGYKFTGSKNIHLFLPLDDNNFKNGDSSYKDYRICHIRINPNDQSLIIKESNDCSNKNINGFYYRMLISILLDRKIIKCCSKKNVYEINNEQIDLFLVCIKILEKIQFKAKFDRRKDIMKYIPKKIREKGIDRKELDLSEIIKNRKNKICVFLSHKSIDKNKVKEIALQLATFGYDYYLDENDLILSKANSELEDNGLSVDKNNLHQIVVKQIELGIEKSTHFLCITSKNTKDSIWVPFEIGFVRANKNKFLKSQGKNLICRYEIEEADNNPSFLAIISRIESIEKYIESLN